LLGFFPIAGGLCSKCEGLVARVIIADLREPAGGPAMGDDVEREEPRRLGPS